MSTIQDKKSIEEIEIEAANHARRVVALKWASPKCEKAIAGAWEAGYVFACIDRTKLASESPSKGMGAAYVYVNEFIGEVDPQLLKQEVFDIDFGGSLMLQITNINGKWTVTNGMNGYGNNVREQYKDSEVKILYESDPSNPVVDEQAKRLAEALLFVNKLLVRFDAEGRWNDCSDCERLIQLLTRPNT